MDVLESKMKIYNKIVFDCEGNVIEEDSYNYEGPLALAIPVAIVGAVASIAGQLAGAGMLGTAAAGLASTAVLGGVTAGTLLTVGGTAASVIGSTVGSAMQQQQAAKANIQGINVEKEQTMKVAEERSRRRLMAGDREISSAIARLGASNINISDSPLDVLMEDAANIKLGALDDIYAGKTSSSAKEYEAKLERFRGNSATISSVGRSSRTILGAATDLGTSIGGRKVMTTGSSHSSAWYDVD